MILSFLILAAILDFFLALLVLKNSSKSWQNRYFAIFVAAGGLWAIGDSLMLFSDNPHLLKLGIDLYLIAPVITTLFLVYFIHIFPRAGRELSLNPLFTTLAAANILFCLFATDSIIKGVAISPGQNQIAVNESGYFLYNTYFIVCLAYACLLLWKRYRSSKIGLEKAQLAYCFSGIVFASLLSGLTNILLPNLGNTDYVWVGPLSSLFFGAMIGVAIVRHRLFDVRLVAARSLAYLLSVGVLIASYIGLSSLLASRLFGENMAPGPLISTADIVLIIFVALTFGPLKRFFDKLTDRIFYREAYSPQIFLDELNKVIAGTVELSSLLSAAASVIEKHLKSQSCGVIIARPGHSQARLAGGDYPDLEPEDIDFMYSELVELKQKIVLGSALSSKQKNLKRLFEHRNIAVCVCLETAYGSNEQLLAYLVLGQKKSNNLYNKQDLGIIEIIADELVIAIQNALRFEEIQEFNATLQARINEATEELTRANSKLKALDTSKDEFISLASHQLRTPLTSVKGYLSMVLEGEGGKLSAMQRKLLNQAFVSSQRMVYLISDLLNVSRLKTGKFIMSTAPTSLSDIIESEIAQLAETAGSKQIKLEFKKPKDFPLLELDETKIRQVIMNFADNAIYYTPNGGRIRIELQADAHSIYFKVKDSGLGVPAGEQARLFTKFYRASNARKARPDGTGLGLFMAKKVVNAQGGTILFESKEGKGSTFGFSFERSKLVSKG